VGEYDEIQGDYSTLLASSAFCLVVPGHGWSARMDDATLHGWAVWGGGQEGGQAEWGC
jgi:hypothetical protein